MEIQLFRHKLNEFKFIYNEQTNLQLVHKIHIKRDSAHFIVNVNVPLALITHSPNRPHF